MLSVVDLFAGCGGMSLGLELAGFTPVLAAELNDSARATYMLNRADRELAVFGDVRVLARKPPATIAGLAGLPNGTQPTLVAGGPPCQGFSSIGHRRTNKDVERHEIVSNHLYRDMVRVIHKLEPHAFLFENVQGILWARWSRGDKETVWDHVRRYFLRALRDRYVIAYQVVRCYDYGVVQNRPRVLMVGLRRDHWEALCSPYSAGQVNEATAAGRGMGVQVGLLPPPISWERHLPDLQELLGDLVDDHWSSVDPATGRAACRNYPFRARGDWQVALRARHSTKEASVRKGAPLEEQEYSRHSPEVQRRFELIRTGKEIPVRMRTKKFAQRVLPATWENGPPRITVASLPDDYVHWAHPRSLTVREWARMQGFPDWYMFAGPRSTGGHRRAGDVRSGDSVREAPKYTQIGNAVPVPLAAAVGWHLRSLLGVPANRQPIRMERTILARLLKSQAAKRLPIRAPFAQRGERKSLVQTAFDFAP